MKSITSLQNAEIKKLITLHTAKERKNQGLCIAEGFRTISTMIMQGMQVNMLYITEKYKEQALQLTDQNNICLVNEAVMQKITTTTTPPGILGIFKILQPQTRLQAGIVLADITDPGNMGTLIRTAVACGVKTVVTIEGTDPWSPKVIQSTAGNIASVNIYQYTWGQLLKEKNNLELYALVVKHGEKLQTVKKQKSLLVIGNEAHGIRDTWLNTCEHKITLQMHENTESLNAAIAGSIALYITHMGC